MAKIATDLEQSKKLAKILPIESADMYYWYSGKRYYIESMDDGDYVEGNDIPAWSLSKLMDMLPQPAIDDDGNEQELVITKEEDGSYWMCYKDIETNKFEDFDASGEDLVDACVEMIKHLHKNNLL